MNKICGIYKITSPTGKVYIGQSVDINKRFRVYRSSTFYNKQTLLARSLKKHGHENHLFEIIIECLPDQLNEMEVFYIKDHNSFNSETGLNLKSGGQNGGSCSDLAKEKLRKPKSKETKEKLRQAALGRKYGEETKEKHRQRMKGNKNLLGSSHMIGFKHTDETRATIKEKRKGQIMPTGFKRPWSEEQKRNKSLAMMGKNNPRYKDGKKCKKTIIESRITNSES